MLGRRQTSNPTRAHLLQTLFLFVERDEQRVQIQVARLLLAVCIQLFKKNKNQPPQIIVAGDGIKSQRCVQATVQSF